MKTFNPFLISCITVLFLSPKSAVSQTDFNDISPIIYKHCVSCHQPGGYGGFSLTNYSEAVTYTGGILNAITNKTMPPIFIDTTYNNDYVGYD